MWSISHSGGFSCEVVSPHSQLNVVPSLIYFNFTLAFSPLTIEQSKKKEKKIFLLLQGGVIVCFPNTKTPLRNVAIK